MKLLTTREAAAFLHKPAGTLRYWRSVGIGPSYIKMGRTVLYDQSVLTSFVAEHTILPSVRTQAGKEAIRVSH